MSGWQYKNVSMSWGGKSDGEWLGGSRLGCQMSENFIKELRGAPVELKKCPPVQAGCLPVILSNGWQLPLAELVDWRRAVVIVDERQLLQVQEYSILACLKQSSPPGVRGAARSDQAPGVRHEAADSGIPAVCTYCTV